MEAGAEAIRYFRSLLSADERDRASLFDGPSLADEFVTSRGVLRLLCGRYLNAPPRDITFAYGPFGKPHIEGSPQTNFNLSHTSGLALFAFTGRCGIGVDIERLHEIPGMMQIAQDFFAKEELSALASLPDDQRRLSFFSCWTRKEAVVKSGGGGLSIPLDAFAVTLRPGEPAEVVRASAAAGADAWRLHDIDLGRDFVAAVAYHGAYRPLRLLPTTDADGIASG